VSEGKEIKIRAEYILWGSAAVTFLLLAWKALFLAAALAFGFALAFRYREEPVKFAGMFLLPAVVGMTCAFAAATFTRAGLEAKAALFHEAPPPAVSPAVWLKRGEAQTADTAGRWGFIAGTLAGVTAAGVLSGRIKHGPGFVRWSPVRRGGWADAKDIADRCEFGYPKTGAGGIPLGAFPDSKQLVRVIPEKGSVKMAGHAVVVGATGTGKSYSIIRPWIIAAAEDGHSIVVTDPKGELFTDMGAWLKEKGYNVRAFNIIDPRYSDWWNILAECKDYDEIKKLASWLINAAGDDHAFFGGGEKNLLDAVMALTKYALSPEEAHFRSALSLLSWPQDKLDEAFVQAFREKKIPQDVLETWRAVQGHFSNYVEGVRNKLREMTQGPLAALTSRTDIEMESLGKEKTALFLILPTEGGDLQALLVSMYGLMFSRLSALASKSPGGRLPVPVRFILDEFANIGRIPEIETQLTVGRGRGVMVQIAIQNIGQIKGLYSKKRAWEAIIGNCPIKICLGLDDLASADFFCAYAGKAEIYHESESREVTMPWQKLEIRKKRESTREAAVIQDYELLQLPEDDMVALIRGKPPLYLQKCAWTKYPQAREIADAGQYSVYEAYEAKDLTVQVPPYPEDLEDNVNDENSNDSDKGGGKSKGGKSGKSGKSSANKDESKKDVNKDESKVVNKDESKNETVAAKENTSCPENPEELFVSKENEESEEVLDKYSL